MCIGDGLSRANLLSADSLENLVKSLVENKIPVSSYVVGANVDGKVPGALAANTGGMIYNDAVGTPAEAGKSLAAAADATLLWPKSVTWPAAFDLVLPKRVPPLRSDRDSVVIGTLKGKGPFEVRMAVDGAAQPLIWNAPPAQPADDNSYLKRLWTWGTRTEAWHCPWLDRRA